MDPTHVARLHAVRNVVPWATLLGDPTWQTPRCAWMPGSSQKGVPDVSILPATHMHDEPAHRWREPSRSTATRRPSEKPNAAARPILVSPEDWREILCESELEAKAAVILMARPDCKHLHEQPAPIRYVDHEGIERRHTFDFLMVLWSGVRIAVVVKPIPIVERRALNALVRRIAAQMDPRFAKGILLMTDRMMSRAKVANARLIHDAKRLPDPHVDLAILGVLNTLNGATTIASIVRAAGLDGHDQGFYAVARTIGTGLALPVGGGLITPETLVVRLLGREGR